MDKDFQPTDYRELYSEAIGLLCKYLQPPGRFRHLLKPGDNLVTRGIPALVNRLIELETLHSAGTIGAHRPEQNEAWAEAWTSVGVGLPDLEVAVYVQDSSGETDICCRTTPGVYGKGLDWRWRFVGHCNCCCNFNTDEVVYWTTLPPDAEAGPTHLNHHISPQ